MTELLHLSYSPVTLGSVAGLVVIRIYNVCSSLRKSSKLNTGSFLQSPNRFSLIELLFHDDIFQCTDCLEARRLLTDRSFAESAEM